MPRYAIGAMTAALILVLLVGGAAGQGTTATVRTHQGTSYQVSDPSLEVFYTIGEPKEKKEEGEKFQPTINVTTRMTAPGGAGDQPTAGGPGAEKEEKLLRGHSRATEIAVSKDGAETRIGWDRIRAIYFTRKPVPASGLPPYITHYRYAVSLTLMGGETVEGDYVNLGTTVLRGTTPNGRVDIPWEEIAYLIIER